MCAMWFVSQVVKIQPVWRSTIGTPSAQEMDVWCRLSEQKLDVTSFFFSVVVCFDAKINFDDNAEFRQKDVFAMDNTAESDPTETEAAKYDLKYIGLDGNIACFGEFVLLIMERNG